MTTRRRPLGYDDYGFPPLPKRVGEKGAPGEPRFDVVGVEGDLTRREVQALEDKGSLGIPMRVEDDKGKPVMTTVPHAEKKQLRYNEDGQPNARSFYLQRAEHVAGALANETGQAQAIVDKKSGKVIMAIEPGVQRKGAVRDRYLK